MPATAQLGVSRGHGCGILGACRPPTPRSTRCSSRSAATRRAPPCCSTSTACSRRSSPQPDDAHMPETTRRPLIEVARALRHRRLRVRPPGVRRAADRRRSARSPTSATTARRSCARARSRRSSTASCRPGRGACRASCARRTARSSAGCASASRTRRRSPRCTGAACPTRRAPSRRSAAVADRAEAAGYRTHWGRKVLEIRPPVRIDKGAGIVALLRDDDHDAAIYVGDDRTDLDAFRGLDELVDMGRAAAPRSRRRALRRGAAGARARGGRDGRRDRRACARCSRRSSRADVARCAVRRLPQGDGAALRGRRDAARRADDRAAARAPGSRPTR